MAALVNRDSAGDVRRQCGCAYEPMAGRDVARSCGNSSQASAVRLHPCAQVRTLLTGHGCVHREWNRRRGEWPDNFLPGQLVDLAPKAVTHAI